MGFGIEADKVVMEFADCGIFAGSHFVQGRILDDISAVAHRILDFLHGMASCARESGLGGGGMQILPDRSIHHAVQQDSRIVTPTTPFGRLDPVDILHIHNRFAIPLIVEGGEVMRRFVPLFVDVGVAAALGTGLGGQKEIGGDQVAGIGLDGSGEERSIGATAFLIHTGRGREWVFHQIVGVGSIVLD